MLSITSSKEVGLLCQRVLYSKMSIALSLPRLSTTRSERICRSHQSHPPKARAMREMMDSRLPLRVKATHRVKAISQASLVVVRLLSLKVGAMLSSQRKPMVLLCPRLSTSLPRQTQIRSCLMLVSIGAEEIFLLSCMASSMSC